MCRPGDPPPPRPPLPFTDVALQAGEQLTGSGPVAAGDTVRWIIGDTESGTGAAKKVHILIKPTRSDLVTNLVINTDRRTYFLELRSTEKTYMASVSWQYPEDRQRRMMEAGGSRSPVHWPRRDRYCARWSPTRQFDRRGSTEPCEWTARLLALPARHCLIARIRSCPIEHLIWRMQRRSWDCLSSNASAACLP